MPDQKDKIGALWARETRGGSEYYTGTIEFGGMRQEIVIFRNGFKTADNHPFFIVYKSTPRVPQTDEPL
jgi:hypothetical protein